MPVEHVLLKKETTLGTWATPSAAYPFKSWSVDNGVNWGDLRDTGTNRSLRNQFLQHKAVSGSFSANAYWTQLGLFFLAAGFTRVTNTQPDAVNSATVYEHGMLQDDTAVLKALSVQIKKTSAKAHNLRGVVINKLKLGCKAKEPVAIDGDYVAIDEAITGGTWDDAASAPAVVASPTYFGASTGIFTFKHAVLTYGGTPALDGTSKSFSISGGSNLAIVESAEITLDNGIDSPHFLGAYVPGNHIPQNRSITGRFDIDWSTLPETYYSAMKAGTELALQLIFTGPVISDDEKWVLSWTLPAITLNAANFPDAMGDQARRKQSVEFTAHHDATSGYDSGVTLIDTEASY